MRQDFDLQPKIYDIVQKLFEAGLFVKWNTDSQRWKRYEISDDPVIQLTVADIAFGLFFFTFIGSLMSIATFVCERIIFLKMKQRNKHTVWIYLEQFVDGHRHYLNNLPEKLARK